MTTAVHEAAKMLRKETSDSTWTAGTIRASGDLAQRSRTTSSFPMQAPGSDTVRHHAAAAPTNPACTASPSPTSNANEAAPMPDLLAAATPTASKRPVRQLSRTERVTADVEKRLADGTYEPGTVLPATRTLGAEFGVSQTLVQLALQPLRDSGAVQAVAGRGHVVVDPTASAPVITGAAEIEKTLRARLRDGTYAVGTWLPSLRELMHEFAVTVPTIHRAVGALRDEGLVIPVKPLGMYVGDPNQPDAPPPSTPPVNARDLRRTLRVRLRNGTYPPGTQLPSLHDLCTEFSAGPHTVTTALTHLHTRGHLITGPDSSRLFAPPPMPRRRTSSAA
ncbi:GntR family transcriptional regulator [Streptomyces sp. NPDC002701]|uniref:GntR family transcriptional regulator n=1 Tax=Streptomyces sp. NPDC002701 TaxID=3364661 RepID=UPI0036C0C425